MRMSQACGCSTFACMQACYWEKLRQTIRECCRHVAVPLVNAEHSFYSGPGGEATDGLQGARIHGKALKQDGGHLKETRFLVELPSEPGRGMVQDKSRAHAYPCVCLCVCARVCLGNTFHINIIDSRAGLHKRYMASFLVQQDTWKQLRLLQAWKDGSMPSSPPTLPVANAARQRACKALQAQVGAHKSPGLAGGFCLYKGSKDRQMTILDAAIHSCSYLRWCMETIKCLGPDLAAFTAAKKTAWTSA
eukprot:scaffold71981_cov17-Tisochrysis_lutea.AAC.1